MIRAIIIGLRHGLPGLVAQLGDLEQTGDLFVPSCRMGSYRRLFPSIMVRIHGAYKGGEENLAQGK